MTDPKDIKVGDEVEWKWGGAKHISGHVSLLLKLLCASNLHSQRFEVNRLSVCAVCLKFPTSAWHPGKLGMLQVVDKQEEGKAQIESKGKTITRNAEPDNPAYTIEGARNPVLKKGSELEKTGDGEEDDEEEEEVPEAADDDEEAEDEEEADEAAAAGDAPASSGVRTRAQAKKAVS